MAYLFSALFINTIHITLFYQSKWFKHRHCLLKYSFAMYTILQLSVLPAHVKRIVLLFIHSRVYNNQLELVYVANGCISAFRVFG